MTLTADKIPAEFHKPLIELALGRLGDLVNGFRARGTAFNAAVLTDLAARGETLVVTSPKGNRYGVVPVVVADSISERIAARLATVNGEPCGEYLVLLRSDHDGRLFVNARLGLIDEG